MSSTNAVAKLSQETPPPWGIAHPQRGAQHHARAVAFVTTFPVGTTLSAEAFDEWAQKHGWLNVPTGAPKQSDAWLAHLQRRHHLHHQINKAGAHPRMKDAKLSPFTIEAIASGVWEVRTPVAAIGRNPLPHQIASLILTKRRRLGYLMQSADWSVLPAHERTVAETLYDDIEMFRRLIELQADGLQLKFIKLQTKLRNAVESGALHPRNHGIQSLIAVDETDEEPADE